MLSHHRSWRTRGLEAAARLTDIELQIPPQPNNPKSLISAFQGIGPDDVNHPPTGSATAWLAHLDLIKFAVASDFETALIIEDDVDWDISVKEQMKLLSRAIRDFTGTPASDPRPYGLDWDILWFGHCGGPYDRNSPRHEYWDPSVRDGELYTGWMKDYVTSMPEKTRYVQHGAGLVCSFAYAINRKTVTNVLDWSGQGQDEGFDIRLRTGCMNKKINCVSVYPELMHHHEPTANYISEVRQGDGKGQAGAEDALESEMGITANIRDSARCAALWGRPCPAPPGTT